MDGALSIWDILAARILSLGGVVGRMERNGGVQGMLFPTKSIVKDTSIEAAIVQESLWKATLAKLPLDPPAQRGCHRCLLQRHR